MTGIDYDVHEAMELLRRTPTLLTAWLRGLPEAWTTLNEGGTTFSPRDVIGHLLYGEQADWIPRARIILAHGVQRKFEPFDRFAQDRLFRGATTDELLERFSTARDLSLRELAAFELDDTKLDQKGRHPEFGEVTLRQHLATWVAHDLNHVGQIARVMAKQLKEAVGPWAAYLRSMT
jgi:hypothetical protein